MALERPWLSYRVRVLNGVRLAHVICLIACCRKMMVTETHHADQSGEMDAVCVGGLCKADGRALDNFRGHP